MVCVWWRGLWSHWGLPLPQILARVPCFHSIHYSPPFYTGHVGFPSLGPWPQSLGPGSTVRRAQAHADSVAHFPRAHARVRTIIADLWTPAEGHLGFAFTVDWTPVVSARHISFPTRFFAWQIVYCQIVACHSSHQCYIRELFRLWRAPPWLTDNTKTTLWSFMSFIHKGHGQISCFA